MSSNSEIGIIHVRDINLWSHVGVLQDEKLLGQRFLLDFSIWLPMDLVACSDDLSDTGDYSTAIQLIQSEMSNIKCNTIEYFSERILDYLETLYGPIPMRIYLRKCEPPITGFSGNVGVERFRNHSPIN